MARNADDISRQSPTPSGGEEGTDLRTVARQVEGLLDDDGHFNPDPEQVSRGHPDYDESTDERAKSPQRDDRGRFTAAEDDPGDEQQPDEEDETLDIPAGDDPDEDTEQKDGDTDEDQAESASEDAKTDDADTGEIQTLAEFANALEITVDDLKEGITHTFNAAGEEITVTLAELESGYQKDADYRRSTAKLAQDRQIAEQDFSNRFQGYEQQNHFLAAQLQTAENLVGQEMMDPRLATLRESDPAEWTARREEIGQRLQGLRDARNQAAQAYNQFTYTAKQQLRQREETALLSAMPDFDKPHRAIAKELMSSMGYAEHEISEVFDHRMILGVLELAAARKELTELRELKANAANTARRIKKDIPKLQKPGKPAARKPGLRKDNIAKLRTRAQKSGSIDDAARVIEQLI